MLITKNKATNQVILWVEFFDYTDNHNEVDCIFITYPNSNLVEYWDSDHKAWVKSYSHGTKRFQISQLMADENVRPLAILEEAA